MPRSPNAAGAGRQVQNASEPRFQEDMFEDSVMATKALRVGLYELLDAVNGMDQSRRDRLAPKIEELLKRSEGAPTMFEVVRSRRAGK